MRDERLALNFTRSEFACKGIHCCDNSAPIDRPLVILLQCVRDEFHAPVKVTSGFRCRAHNAKTPNAHPDSYHTLGIASDITCITPTKLDDLFLACNRAAADLGYGYFIFYRDRNIIHVDTRNY